MKAKQLIKTHLLPLVVFCSMVLAAVSCANEDIVQNNTGSDNDKNFTEFVGGRLETRTTMDYNSGDFYWEAGDKIYVQDDNNVWQVSNNAPTDKVASFKFKVPGKFTDKASYKVYYPGKNGTNNNVTIPTTQNQTVPNSTTHFGVSGDCGAADAKRADNFHFTLDHQAAILVFQPYNSNTELNDCYLTKIEVTSDNNITGTYTLNSSTGELTGTGSGKQITLNTTGSGAYANGFPVKTTSASVGTNGAYMLIQPGTHTLKVRYWVKDVFTNIEEVFTKDLSSFVYDKNTYYDMALNMNLKNYEPNYCTWDAQQPFWYGHEWNATNLSDRWQPVVSVNSLPHASEISRPTSGPRAASTVFPGAGVRNDAVNLCKDCPNANEMAWYVEKGDMHVDENILWTGMGHLRKGGFWLKTKAKMASDNSTTVANIKDFAPDGTDWRNKIMNPSMDIETIVTTTTPPSASDLNNYFFLPALGYFWDVSPTTNGFYIGGNLFSGYWSSSSIAVDGACAIYIRPNTPSGYKIQFQPNQSRSNNILSTWKFE